MPSTPIFECEPCSRCGGSGKYSYCQTYGSTCFGCAGSGKKLTKRGKAASEFLRALRTVKARDVQFGDCVLCEGVAGFSRTTYARIDSMYTRLRSGSHIDAKTGETVYSNHLYLDGDTPKGERYGLGTFPDADVRLVPTKAVAAEQIAKALAFQATLTKAGTVAKRATVAMRADEANHPAFDNRRIA